VDEAILVDRDSPTRLDRSIKMSLYLYINFKFNGPNILLLFWKDRAATRYGPQDGPLVARVGIMAAHRIAAYCITVLTSGVLHNFVPLRVKEQMMLDCNLNVSE
jgi:hypothetical protein